MLTSKITVLLMIALSVAILSAQGAVYAALTPSLNITAAPGNFTFNGTAEFICGSSNSPNGASLYINGTFQGFGFGGGICYRSVSPGVYHVILNTTSGNNYSAASLSNLIIIRSPQIDYAFYAVIGIIGAIIVVSLVLLIRMRRDRTGTTSQPIQIKK